MQTKKYCLVLIVGLSSLLTACQKKEPVLPVAQQNTAALRSEKHVNKISIKQNAAARTVPFTLINADKIPDNSFGYMEVNAFWDYDDWVYFKPARRQNQTWILDYIKKSGKLTLTNVVLKSSDRNSRLNGNNYVNKCKEVHQIGPALYGNSVYLQFKNSELGALEAAMYINRPQGYLTVSMIAEIKTNRPYLTNVKLCN